MKWAFSAVVMTAMLAIVAAVLQSKAGHVAQVNDFIADEHCKEAYIRFHKKACVLDNVVIGGADTRRCFPHGTDGIHGCRSITQWQWFNPEDPARSYAPGVNAYPIHRKLPNGDASEKLVWAYTGDIKQGEAYQVYNPAGQVTVSSLLNSAVNHITFIANVDVENSTHWFSPGKNNTDGCGQLQTWELPFGYSGHNATTSLPRFQSNLKEIHDKGVTITLTMGSWCTQFPVLKEEEWTPDEFAGFVSYFEEIRQDTFGGSLDGIDFDWEGFCKNECLKAKCTCGWNDAFCGQFSPEDLAQGKTYEVPSDSGGAPLTYMCWILPTPSTLQVLTGITHYMKKAGYVVTLVPMSTALYSGEADTTPNQVGRNEYVKWRNQPYAGGNPIDGSGTFNLLDMVDGVLLQWYSGFDAALCHNAKDPHACTCDNMPDDDYPNVLNVSKDGMISSYYYIDSAGGNMFPSTFPVRCQACGKKVLLPNGTHGTFPCFPEGEDWFIPGNTSNITASHVAGYANYTKTHNGSIPYWWVKGMEINSKCPRAIDCPDWRYKGEANYSRMMNLLSSISKVVDLNKVSIGFETLGIDVQVQMQAYQDPALPWPDVTQEEIDNGTYYHPCTTNMTKENIAGEKRCSQPLLSQQWGAKFKADDIVGLINVVQTRLGKTLAGIGMFTLDGVLYTPDGVKRMWWNEMIKLNETFKIPCRGNAC